MVLVDTTVWIELLHDRPLANTLRQLLEDGEAAIAPVVLQEILAGARNPKALTTLRRRFSALPMLMPSPGTYAEAGALYARCRWRGITPRSPHDCLLVKSLGSGLAMTHFAGLQDLTLESLWNPL
jgi:hypothetical protein